MQAEVFPLYFHSGCLPLLARSTAAGMSTIPTQFHPGKYLIYPLVGEVKGLPCNYNVLPSVLHWVQPATTEYIVSRPIPICTSLQLSKRQQLSRRRGPLNAPQCTKAQTISQLTFTFVISPGNFRHCVSTVSVT